jgi:hypothetical protein
MRNVTRVLFAVLLVFGISAVAMAQDDDVITDDDIITDVDVVTYEDPDVDAITEVTSDETIEAITDDSEAYYGAVVTIEGTLSNFVGTHIFEVSEDELFTNSIVLVVNNSSQAFPSTLVEGALVQVTGRVHPSYDELLEGYDWAFTPFDENAPQTDTERMNMIDFVHSGYVPEEFGEHTLVEVLNVENVEIIGYDDLLTID